VILDEFLAFLDLFLLAALFGQLFFLLLSLPRIRRIRFLGVPFGLWSALCLQRLILRWVSLEGASSRVIIQAFRVVAVQVTKPSLIRDSKEVTLK
jgi:hypothetical protein